MQKTSPIYVPTGIDASERWATVRDALEEAGFTNLRPAPAKSLSYRPKHQRPRLVQVAPFVYAMGA